MEKQILEMRAEQIAIMKRFENNLIKLDEFSFDNKDKWHVRITADQIKLHNAKTTQNLKWHVRRITADQIKLHNAKTYQNLEKAKIERINI